MPFFLEEHSGEDISPEAKEEMLLMMWEWGMHIIPCGSPSEMVPQYFRNRNPCFAQHSIAHVAWRLARPGAGNRAEQSACPHRRSSHLADKIPPRQASALTGRAIRIHLNLPYFFNQQKVSPFHCCKCSAYQRVRHLLRLRIYIIICL